MPTITNKQMDRMKAMAAAKAAITEAMQAHDLTTTEWLKVFNEVEARIIAYELQE